MYWSVNRHAILTHRRPPILTHLRTLDARSARWVSGRRRFTKWSLIPSKTWRVDALRSLGSDVALRSDADQAS